MPVSLLNNTSFSFTVHSFHTLLKIEVEEQFFVSINIQNSNQISWLFIWTLMNHLQLVSNESTF